MRRVSAGAAERDRGIVGYQSDGVLRVDAGIYHRKSAELRWSVFDAGKLAATGLRSASGPAFGKQEEHQNHEPWGPYAAEYEFAEAPCPTCAAGTRAIAFSSQIHDELHGSGELEIDVARAVVLHERFVPNDFGDAKSGTIEIEFGETDLGWRPRSIHGDFVGTVGPITGNAHFEEALHDFRRFPTVESAIATLST